MHNLNHHHRRTRVVVLAWLLLITLLAPLAAHAQSPSARCFDATGYCIDGPIRTYWETNGGLEVFGYPITAQREEPVEGRTLQVQWFERDRLEIQPDGTVTAGRLGARLLEQQGRDWQNMPTSPPVEGCEWFPQTQHNICEPFLSYWQQNGGLERFGLPLTPPSLEVLEGQEILVKYFERRRMEHHAHLPGQPILLGLLGREVLANQSRQADQPAPQPAPSSPVPYPAPGDAALPDTPPECVEHFLATNANNNDPATDTDLQAMQNAYEKTDLKDKLGCPTLLLYRDVPASVQALEGGDMLWFDLPELDIPASHLAGPRFIHAVALDDPKLFWRAFDSWDEESDPATPDVTPPREGLYPPWRGFGKVWINNPEIREAMGWAMEEQARMQTATVMIFNTDDPNDLFRESPLMIYMHDSGLVYIFGNPDNPTQVQIVSAF